MSASRSTVRISLRMTPHDHALLLHYAHAAGLTLPAYLIRSAQAPEPSARISLKHRRGRRRRLESSETSASSSASTPVNRDVFWQMRVPQTIKTRLQQRATASRHSLSDYLVRCGCLRPVSPPLDPHWLRVKQQLARLSNNAHQIARQLQVETMDAHDAVGNLLGAVRQLNQFIRDAALPFNGDWVNALVECGRDLNGIATVVNVHRSVALTMRMHRVAAAIRTLMVKP